MAHDKTPGIPDRRTQSVHAGMEHLEGVWPAVSPIYQTSAFATDAASTSSERLQAGVPNYSRDGFPNQRELEEAIATLEGADGACVTASGMAAISLVFLTFLSTGDHVILAEGSYRDTRNLLDDVFDRFGVGLSIVDVRDTDAVERAVTPRTRMIMAETIANPSMFVPGIDVLAGIAARHNMLLCMDNTFATPLLCQPLAHGAHLVIHSVTKFLGGHHDLTAGVVAGSQELMERVRQVAYLIGAIPGSLDAWLALRGIRTLAPRMAWITQTAETLARELCGHPAICDVHYPALAEGNEADVVRRMLPDGAGGMFSAQLVGGDSAAEAFVRHLRLIPYLPSLGGTTTTVSFPPGSSSASGHARAADGWLRFSVGLESPDALLTDIQQALDAALEEGKGRA